MTVDEVYDYITLDMRASQATRELRKIEDEKKRREFNPSLTFNYPFFLLSSTLRFSFAVLCTTNFSRF